MDGFSVARRSLGVLVVGGLASVVGCGSDEPAGAECISEADCSPQFTCTDGICQLRTSSPDTGSPFASDAGQAGRDGGSRDSGTAAVLDAGTEDTDAGVSTVDSGSPPTGDVCGAAACVAQGAECGQIVDDCSTIIECGGCDIGSSCGEAGTPFANRCRCEPMSCDALGYQCGQITDNCGVQRDCGGCTAPERCGGSGVAANQCGCVMQPQEATAWMLFRSVETAGSGDISWSNLTGALNVVGSDSAQLSFPRVASGVRTTESNMLRLYNAGLEIPAGARITGAEVRVHMRHAGSVPHIQELHFFSPSGNYQSSSIATYPISTTDFQGYRWGGSDDLWGDNGSGLTRDRIINNDFSLRFHGRATVPDNASSLLLVDAAYVRVHYEACL